MILGMTYLSLLLLPTVMRLMLDLFLCCCRKDRKLKPVILKNFASHEKRNTKTALMFSITLSFVVFSASTFALLTKLIVSTLEASLGNDFYARSLDNSLGNMLDQGAVTEFLQTQKLFNNDVEDWSYSSYELG